VGRRTIWTVYILTVAYFIAILGAIVGQPVYRAGIDIVLLSEGYEVERLVRGTPLDEAGILPGDLIIEINGYDAQELYRLAHESSREYLRTVSEIFQADRELRVRTARGGEYTMVLEPRPFRFRLISANRTVLSNLIFGLLLATIGTGFALRARTGLYTERYGARSFFVFTIAGAIAISLSYFHSLWRHPFLVAWFVALEGTGVIAIMAMVVFALRFPQPVHRGIRTALVLMILPPLGRAVLLATSRSDPLGPGHFFIHVYVVVGILAFALIEVIRYRHSAARSRRRIRWIFLGAFVSILPYLLYMLLIILAGSFIEHERAGLFNQIAGFVLLLFPVTVGFGLTRFRSLDVDRLIAQSVVYLLLGSTTALVVLLFTALNLGSSSAVVPILIILAVTFFGPGYFASVERWATGHVLRRHGKLEQAVERLNQHIELSGDTNSLFTTVQVFLTETFQPRYLRLRRINKPGEALSEFQPDEKRWVPSIAVPVSDSYQACTRFCEFRLVLRIRNPASADRYELLLGPRSDEDIYVDSDLAILRRVIDRIEQRLPAVLYLDRLREKIQELQRALADRTELLQEVQHRVNNNLQVMSSLVRLREREISDDAMRVHFRIVRDEIDAMAFLYESVYNRGLLRTVDMRTYLGSIARKADGRETCSGGALRVRSDIEAVTTSPPIALPCGLLSMGCISILHSVACTRPGLSEIVIRFRLVSPVTAEALLEIEHDGPAMREHITGSDISHSLASQLGGTLTYSVGMPHRVSVRFTIPERPDYAEGDPHEPPE